MDHLRCGVTVWFETVHLNVLSRNFEVGSAEECLLRAGLVGERVVVLLMPSPFMLRTKRLRRVEKKMENIVSNHLIHERPSKQGFSWP